MSRALSCLSRWFTPLAAAGLPVPRTRIRQIDFRLPHPEMISEGSQPAPPAEKMAELFQWIREAGDEMGWPCFLRTGMGSGKHSWKRTCFLERPEDIEKHVWALVEWSHECDMFGGVPCDVWVVREMLRGKAGAILDAYEGMPLVPEWRFFVQDGEVICAHPYWPALAICKGFKSEPENIGKIISASRSKENSGGLLRTIGGATKALAGAFPGESWSVDAMLANSLHWQDDTWFVTDCAQAGLSWHWPGCEHEKKFKVRDYFGVPPSLLGEPSGQNYASKTIAEFAVKPVKACPKCGTEFFVVPGSCPKCGANLK